MPLIKEKINIKGDDNMLEEKVRIIEPINMCNDALFKSVFRNKASRGYSSWFH